MCTYFASLMSSAVTVFLPACLASLMAFIEMLAARSSRMRVREIAASALTLPALAFLMRRSTDEGGISVMGTPNCAYDAWKIFIDDTAVLLRKCLK